jgi:hypothetical protein
MAIRPPLNDNSTHSNQRDGDEEPHGHRDLQRPSALGLKSSMRAS